MTVAGALHLCKISTNIGKQNKPDCMKTLVILSFFGILLLGPSILHAQNCKANNRAAFDSYSVKKHCLSSCTRAMVSFGPDIIQISDGDNYETRFLRKTICSNTGIVSYQEVEFDHQNGRFVVKSADQKIGFNQTSCKIQCLQTEQQLAFTGQSRT